MRRIKSIAVIASAIFLGIFGGIVAAAIMRLFKQERSERCLTCGQPLNRFPARNANQRCPSKEEIKQGHYNKQ